MADSPLTIVFMPESAYGPTNNCIGIGKILERRGHRVVFAAEASWKGRLEPLGFEEDLVDLARLPRSSRTPASSGRTVTETAGFRADDRATRRSSRVASLIDGARYCEPQLREILDRTSPT
jgi:UDP:flavonoid glycosyltransferase YjiC (YdhE family)